MDFFEWCPRDGTELVPSRIIPLEGWKECPTCGYLYGEPDLKDPNDQGVTLEPYKDFDPDPGRGRLQIKPGSSSSGRSPSNNKRRDQVWFPLPLPRQGSRINRK